VKSPYWVLLIAAVLILWALGGHDLWAPDEPYFAEGAREMVVDGEWAVPHVNGVVTTDKPPLFFWLIALLSLPLGTVTPLTARLPSALAALATLALVIRLGAKLYGPRTAAVAGLMLSTTYLFWAKARWSQIDSLLCCLIWVALSAFVAWRAGEADGHRAGLLFWVAAALAVLSKGPVGFLLPLGIALMTLMCDRELRRWRTFAPLSGPLLFALVIAAWMVFATVGGHGEYSVWGALKEHFLERGMHGMHHRQPFWYYGKMLPVLLLPWSALAVGGVVLAWRRRGLNADRFLLATAAFVVAFFTLSTEKRGLYVLPAMPAFALMTARLTATAAGWAEAAGSDREGRSARRWAAGAQVVMGGLLALVGAALPFTSGRLEGLSPPLAFVAGGAVLTAGAATVVLALRGSVVASVVAPAAAVGVLFLVVVTWVYPVLEPRKSARPFALRIEEATAASRAAGHTLLAFDLSNLPEPFAFYTDGMYTEEVWDPARLEAHLAQDAEVFAVVNAPALDELGDEIRARLVVVDRADLSRRHVVLVANHPVPEAELLTP